MKTIAQRLEVRVLQLANIMQAVEAVLAGLALYVAQCIAQ